MPIIINLNRTHVMAVNGGTNPYNNTMVYNLSQNVNIGSGNEIALSQLTMAYSFPSVDTTNCGFELKWIDGTSYPVTYARGTTQSADTFNSQLQYVMETNLLYLLDGTTKVYYANIVTNAPYYALQLNTWALPTALPAGWTIPVGATWVLPAAIPGSTKHPQFIIAADNEFSELTGIAAGTYPLDPTSYSSYSKLSDVTPQLTPQSTINVLCNIAQNDYTIPSEMLASVPIGNTQYGQEITFLPPERDFIAVKAQNIRTIIVTIQDAEGNPLWILDPNYTVRLVIRDREEAKRMRRG